MNVFDSTDAGLLELLQGEFPIVERPFDSIGDTLGISGSEVVERVSRLKRDGIIRQISAIFDSGALGYKSELVAFKTAPDALETVAAAVCTHQGVSHCYSRDADYNLWFTISVGPDANLDQEIESLAGTPGVAGFLRLPQKKLFKIGVFLGVTGNGASKQDLTRQNRPEISRKDSVLDPKFGPFIQLLQHDLPISATPFADMAGAANMTESDLISAARELLANGTMRRFAAVLRHVTAGFEVNAMICWAADSDEIENAGIELAKYPSVSHCYERATAEDWPWPLYTMVHCRTESELDQVISELSAASHLTNCRVLRTVREYKKTRVRYSP